MFGGNICDKEGYIHRDIKDTTVGTLSQRITNQLMGLKGLHSHIRDIDAYVGKVVAGKLPINHQVNQTLD